MPSSAVRIGRWPPSSVTSLQHSLDELASLLDELMRKGDREREVEWLARLLVIRSCGYLEQVVSDVAFTLTQERSGGLIRSFAHSWFPQNRNPSPDQIVTWVGRFSATWSNELADLLHADDELLHRELSLLLDRRNRIAHGLNEGITGLKALDMKATACTIADWFVLRFNPSR